MEFRFQCFVVRHVSERVTVIPLEVSDLVAHAVSLERAMEDLTLALDDRIARAHPRHVGAFARRSNARAVVVPVAALPVWSATGVELRPLRVTALISPAHRPFVEVRAPRLDLRVWLPAGADVEARAAEAFAAHLSRLTEEAILALRSEGDETLADLVVEAHPARLASLRRREIELDERPPPLPPGYEHDDGEPEPDPFGAAGEESEEDPDERARDDEWDREIGAAPRSPARAPTPTLRRIGVALHELARAGELDRAFERDELVEALARRLDAARPEAVVLVGPAGVGKTAVLHELIARAQDPSAPAHRRERPAFLTDATRLVAGQGLFGAWEQQTLDALEEARRARAVLCVGRVVDLLDAGKSAHSEQNVAQVLQPVLAARELLVVGEATDEEWARLSRRNQSFAQVFSVVRVPEPAPEATGRILARVALEAGARAGAEVEPAAVQTTLSLARRFWPYGSLLGNSVTFLRRLVASRAHARAERVTGRDTTDLFSSESGIPAVLLRDDVVLEPARVAEFLRARVMGQDAAVERVAEVVAVIKAGLNDARKPLGVLFFAGPTGVGKTELAKSLAEFVFGSADRLARMDMGEYAGPDALARLLGEGRAPGHLTALVRRQPFSVVLLDEIEKAHPAVFDALLGVLGEGRLTDADGRFTDFRNAVIVMTSNLGADTVRAGLGFRGAGGARAAADATRAHYAAEARRFFRPELFNRIDDFIVFDPLPLGVVRRVAEREVTLLQRREGLRRLRASLEVSPEALDLLSRKGYDPRYGARPLKRALEREVTARVAEYLAGHPGPGTTRLVAGAEGDKLALRAQSVPGGDEADARAAAERVLADASALRAEVRRWARSPLVTALGHEVAFFDKASKLPGFWRDRALAERSAQSAAAAREVVERFAAMEKQVQALEDLAFETYYERSNASAEMLRADLAALSRAFLPLAERTYATMFPPCAGAVLYLTAGRGSWHWVPWLLRAYRAVCAKRKLACTAYTARPSREDPAVPFVWEPRAPEPTGSPLPPAAALAIQGTPPALLFASEHGAHRVHEAGVTALVKVRFEPGAAMGPGALIKPHELEGTMPETEVRRVSPSRRLVRDLRTNAEVEFDEHGDADLSAIMLAYLRHRVLGEEAEPWS